MVTPHTVALDPYLIAELLAIAPGAHLGFIAWFHYVNMALRCFVVSGVLHSVLHLLSASLHFGFGDHVLHV